MNDGQLFELEGPGCGLAGRRAIFAVLMTPRMRSQRSKWFLAVLAVLVNLGGGPMAWAHLLGAEKCHEASTPAVSPMPADCPEHRGSGAPGHEKAPAPHGMPCCDGGSCTCAVPHSMPAALFLVQSFEIGIAPTPALSPETVPSTIIDDALRPPIS